MCVDRGVGGTASDDDAGADAEVAKGTADYSAIMEAFGQRIPNEGLYPTKPNDLWCDQYFENSDRKRRVGRDKEKPMSGLSLSR